MAARRHIKALDFAANVALRGILGVLLALPYRWRVPFAGWAMHRIVAPLSGYNRRTRANLALVCPELSRARVREIERAVADNAGRTLIEIYSGREFIDRVRDTPLTGPGVETLMQAHAEHRPAILATAHFGNYDAVRAALIQRGFTVGAIYRPMKNRYFNRHYRRAIAGIGTPIHPRGPKGYRQILRLLKSGGMFGLLFDVDVRDGAELSFFGHPARTALTTAELALRLKAPLIPVYGIRRENGLDFELRIEAPIEPSTPEQMVQALNDGLENLVRQNMGQWFWVHRRWKSAGRQR